MSEQRKAVRIPVKIDTSLRMRSGGHTGQIRNVSSGGCYINSEGVAEFGELLSVESRLASGEVFRFRGKVLHTRPGKGFGMCFIDLSERERLQLERIIEDHRIWESIWCGVPVMVKDDVSHEEFLMPYFDTDPAQQPSFTVTESTLHLVASRADEYSLIIRRMVDEWREGKERFMRQASQGSIPMKPVED